MDDTEIRSRTPDAMEAMALMGYCRAHHLRGVEILDGITCERAAELYNGIGAGWMGAELRSRLTSMLFVLEPAAFLHDLTYSLSADRSREAFDRANRDLLANCLLCTWDRVPLATVRFFRTVAAAVAMYGACRDFGWRAWEEAAR